MQRAHLLVILCLVLSGLLGQSALAQGRVEDSASAQEKVGEAAPSLSGAAELAALDATALAKLDPALVKQLSASAPSPEARGQAAPKVTFLVYMRETAPLEGIGTHRQLAARRVALVQTLQATAERSQADVKAMLNALQAQQRVARYTSYWVFNGLAVEGDLSAAVALAQRPDVASLRANRVHRLAPQPSGVTLEVERLIDWNLTHIGADQVWDGLGVTGRGVVVANLDSGVDWTHPALRAAYRGYNASDPASSSHDHNWFDPTRTYPASPGPNRANISAWSDHGTHTMGTIVGSDAATGRVTGVAPGAKWIAVKVFNDRGEATDEWIHAGFQWCLAPTNLAGGNPNPALAPDIVSNSWGDDNGADLTFQRDFEAWQAAGIVSVWAAGNAGPSAGTINAPGSLAAALAVGATQSNDVVASFSSRGPSPWGVIKPDVVAPGVGIYSTLAGGGYAGGWNGTSMATPHVAGLAALLIEASARSLSLDGLYHAITSTTVELGAPGSDNTYGYGRIDAYQAVSSVVVGGTFAGEVRDLTTGHPVAGATIHMRSRGSGGHSQTVTDATGAYAFRVAEGLYDVTASKFGYESQTAAAVEIRPSTTTLLDFGLARLPSGTLRGVVRPADAGAPVSATVVISDGLISLPVDGTGAYEVVLPEGSYPLTILPGGAGLRGAERLAHVTANETQTLNIDLMGAPRLLVVDADAWTTTGVGALYKSDLDALLWGHDLYSVASSTAGAPSAGLLATYDIVIWAQALSSPGYIGAWEALGQFMEGGGALLISGQDIGYWDAPEGEGMASVAYRQRLHATYLGDNGGLGEIVGLGGGPLAGLALEPNGAGSLGNQTAPDVIAPADALAEPVARYANGEAAALALTGCPTPSLYLGFGLEGVGPTGARRQALEGMLVWLTGWAPRPALRVLARPSAQVAARGQVASFDVELANSSGAPQSLSLEIANPPWAARVVDPISMQPITSRELAPCQATTVRVLVEVPAAAGLFERGDTRLRLTSSLSPTAPTELLLRTEAALPWSTERDMPEGLYRASSVGQGCALYLFGGIDASNATLASVYRFDLAANRWTAMAPKPTPAANLATVLLGDVVYAIGGYDLASSTALATVEAYSLAYDTWSSRAPLPEPASGPAVVALDGRVYALGGGDGERSAGCYVYEIGLDVWSAIASPPTPLPSFARAVALEGRIYLMGGWPASRALLCYDPTTSVWTTLQPMLIGRHSFAAETDGRYIYVAGGGREWDGLSSAERYDPRTDTWVPLPPMKGADRAGSASAMAGGRLHVMGGVGQSDLPSSSVESFDIAPSLGGSAFVSDRAFAQPGESLALTVALRNPTAQAASVGWRYALPAGLHVAAGDLPAEVTYEAATRTLRWGGPLLPGHGRTHYLTVQVDPSTPAGAVLTSTLILEGQDCSTRSLSLVTRVDVPSLAGSTLTVDQTQARPGDVLRYTLRLQNASPFEVPNGLVRCPIPENTAYVLGSVSGASYNVALNRIEWSDSLAPGAASAPGFDWVDATDGQRLDLGDDACAGPLPLGFGFEFYGKPYTSVYVNSNGMVLFEECSTQYSNVAIPNPEAPNAFVAPFWDDLRPDGSGQVFFAVTGAAPNRRAVISWQAVNVYGQDAPQTFQVLLFEGNNQVVLQYLSLSGERGQGSSATVGIEDATGTQGVMYLFNGVPAEHRLYDGLAIEPVHSSTITATRHVVTYQVRVNNPVPPLSVVRNTAWIDDGRTLYAPSVTTTLATPRFEQSSKEISPAPALSGETVQVTLRIRNSGDLDATGVRLTDPVPEPLTFVAGSLSGTGASYDAAQRQVLWQGNLVAGQTAPTVTYRARLAANVPINTRLALPALARLQDVSMATLPAELVVNEVNLGASRMAASATTAQAGARITYTLTLVNSGNHAANGLALSNALPPELEMVPGTLIGGASYDAAARTVRWSGALAPQSERSVRYAALVSTQVANGALISNAMRIEAEPDLTLERSALVTAQRGDLASSAMLVQPVWARPGDTVTYTLRLTNEGALPLGAELVSAPAGPLTLLPGSLWASAGAVQMEGSPGRVTWRGAIGSAQMVIVRYQAHIAPAAAPAVYLNGATVTDDAGVVYTLSVPLNVGISRAYLPLVFRQ